jgi:hypothetical protein
LDLNETGLENKEELSSLHARARQISTDTRLDLDLDLSLDGSSNDTDL